MNQPIMSYDLFGETGHVDDDVGVADVEEGGSVKYGLTKCRS